METRRTFFPEITLLHCIGVLMIFFGHVAQVFNYNLLGEVLITGVPLFLFISGFLTGNKETMYNGNWLKKKARRILIPYYLVIITIFFIFVIWHKEPVLAKQWIVLLTNIQGLSNYVFFNDLMGYWSPLNLGVGHLWFVTIIMLCYLLVPCVNALYKQIPWFKRNLWSVLFFFILVVGPFLFFYNLTLGYFVTFFMGYFFAREKVKMTNELFCVSMAVMVVLLLLRVVSRIWLDNTFIYNHYISGLGSLALGLGIVMIVFYLRMIFPTFIDKTANLKVVVWLESIIYEFYLIHHIIIKGSWSFYKFGYNPILTTVVILVVTVCLSLLLKSATNLLVSKVLKK